MNSSSLMSVEIKEIGIAGYQVKHIEEFRYHSIVHLQRDKAARPACPEPQTSVASPGD